MKTKVRKTVARSRTPCAGHLEGPDLGDDDLLDALSSYIRTENFEEREQRRGAEVRGYGPFWPRRRHYCTLPEG